MGHYKKSMYVVQHGNIPFWACCRLTGGLLAGVWLFAGFENRKGIGVCGGCSLGLKIGLSGDWLVGGLPAAAFWVSHLGSLVD